MRIRSRSVPLFRWTLFVLILFVAPPINSAQVANAESAVLGSWKYNPYPGDGYSKGDLVITLDEHTLEYRLTLVSNKQTGGVITGKYAIESTSRTGSVLTLTSTHEHETYTDKITIEVEMDKITITSNSFKKPSGEFLGRDFNVFSLSPDHKTLTLKYFRSTSPTTIPERPLPVLYVFSR